MRKSFHRLKRISFVLAAIQVALVVFPAMARAGSGFFGANKSPILVQIDKNSQQMTVFLDGAERYRWPVSTGRTGYETPSGTYTATSMNEIWYSKEYDNAPMPHAVFFMKDGHAIHGTFEVKNLGKPASHGCVRISPQNAAILYKLVQENGLENTKVVLTGSSSGEVARARTSPRGESPRPSSEAVYRNRSQDYDPSPWIRW
ncbi:L,D-transpeptidase [uncultured Rhodoblastus sp.]|uniref:L,D-transpeptidase n=1 Tax=uncultured Rhodoblastus sp. TaxID=543037 RepID=UPI0025FA21E8|nr:L,D-transpeptidase [uncultured Rhodoblastus sp.]